MNHHPTQLIRTAIAAAAAFAATLTVSCVVHPKVQPTDFPGLYVPKVTMKTVNEKIPGLGKWAMTVNQGSGYAYTPEDGKVSAYSYDTAGQTTASGELFDPDELTGAHRSLPLHTIVRVTRVDIGSSVDVRINDRTTQTESRVLEVTPKAARKLDLDSVGAAPCRMEVLRYPIVEVPVLSPATPTF